MEKPEPQKEHAWLQRIVGEWTYEGECYMGPDQPPWKTSGTESVRSLGGLWVVGEMTGETPDGTPSTSIITIGYDPASKKFVGTFIATMMTHMWKYEGQLEGDVLTLDTEGPSFSGDGSMATYQDIVELKGNDERILASQVKGEDGKWNRFMTMTFKRKK